MAARRRVTAILIAAAATSAVDAFNLAATCHPGRVSRPVGARIPAERRAESPNNNDGDEKPRAGPPPTTTDSALGEVQQQPKADEEADLSAEAFAAALRSRRSSDDSDATPPSGDAPNESPQGDDPRSVGERRREFLRPPRPPRRRYPREVRGGRDVVEAPRFRNEVRTPREREMRRERDFLNAATGPATFGALGALVAATTVFYAGIFLTGGISDGSSRYAPGFDGTTEAATELYGAVLPNEAPLASASGEKKQDPRGVDSSDDDEYAAGVSASVAGALSSQAPDYSGPVV